MRTTEIELGGARYPAALSLRVLRNLEERSGKPAGEALDELFSADALSIDNMTWLLAQMLAAGATATGSSSVTPTIDELLDKFAIDDLLGLSSAILSGVRTSRPLVELKSVKKKTLREALRMWRR